jgi:hypothetical protein
MHSAASMRLACARGRRALHRAHLHVHVADVGRQQAPQAQPLALAQGECRACARARAGRAGGRALAGVRGTRTEPRARPPARGHRGSALRGADCLLQLQCPFTPQGCHAVRAHARTYTHIHAYTRNTHHTRTRMEAHIRACAPLQPSTHACPPAERAFVEARVMQDVEGQLVAHAHRLLQLRGRAGGAGGGGEARRAPARRPSRRASKPWSAPGGRRAAGAEPGARERLRIAITHQRLVGAAGRLIAAASAAGRLRRPAQRRRRRGRPARRQGPLRRTCCTEHDHSKRPPGGREPDRTIYTAPRSRKAVGMKNGAVVANNRLLPVPPALPKPPLPAESTHPADACAH